MQIRIVEIKTKAGSMHDLVIVQGDEEIRLVLKCPSPKLAAAQLKAWMQENTLADAEIVQVATRPSTLGTYKGAAHARL